MAEAPDKTPAGTQVAGPMSEVLVVPGVRLAGPFPAGLQSYLVFMACVSSASKNADAIRSLIKFLTAPAAAPVFKTNIWSRDDQGHNHERPETAAMR
jgi:molybdate transport system substrate-binding protein